MSVNLKSSVMECQLKSLIGVALLRALQWSTYVPLVIKLVVLLRAL